ncbi:amidohydrolase family protein [uncultured Tessaracoccus sp.]|uniref:N-acyl-D-amino-acid deacylase family protein n=1 Tax=uncultured Tessaracoccus sp. TaxID=905023 RepID=UPI00261315FC|nr:D-aminoacylase [uncultured Tessaracoccus sp.]
MDLLIKNATIVDGTGSEPYFGGLAVDGERIAAVWRDGEDAPTEAATVIDAGGRAVTPGFIDLHSHADFTIHGAPAAETQLHQGVTTALAGNCGSTPFPAKSVDVVATNHSHLDPRFAGEWQDLAGYRDVTSGIGPGINLALQVGLTSIRSFVVGFEERPASPQELDAMRDEIRRAAEQGARGFSSGLIYAPGSYSSEQEMRALVGAAAEAGLLYSTHMRNETGAVLEAVDEALGVAEATGARLEISHLKAMGPENHGKPRQALEMIEAARERGVDVMADVYPYTASSTTLTSRLPGWALSGGKPALLERLRDASVRREIATTLAARFGRDVDPAGVVIAELGRPTSDTSMGWTVGMSLVDIAEHDDCTPEEAAMRVLGAHSATVAIVNHAMSEDDVRTVLAHPLVSVASDGWVLTTEGAGRPHPRSFGTFVRVLERYVRDEGLLTLQEAIRKMTSLPASRLGLDDRGVLDVGNIADVVVLDAANVREHATFEDPKQLATGVSHVILGGGLALVDGEVTPDRFGRIL